jgi:hypothetical protein
MRRSIPFPGLAAPSTGPGPEPRSAPCDRLTFTSEHHEVSGTGTSQPSALVRASPRATEIRRHRYDAEHPSSIPEDGVTDRARSGRNRAGVHERRRPGSWGCRYRPNCNQASGLDERTDRATVDSRTRRGAPPCTGGNRTIPCGLTRGCSRRAGRGRTRLGRCPGGPALRWGGSSSRPESESVDLCGRGHQGAARVRGTIPPTKRLEPYDRASVAGVRGDN